jgi:hypothetical protein
VRVGRGWDSGMTTGRTLRSIQERWKLGKETWRKRGGRGRTGRVLEVNFTYAVGFER